MILPIGKISPTSCAWPLSSKYDRNITSGSMVLNPDFKEFLQLLNDNQVRYLVTGGYTVALHGYPRYTKDLDIWIDQARTMFRN
jgi:hypothetical protein